MLMAEAEMPVLHVNEPDQQPVRELNRQRSLGIGDGLVAVSVLSLFEPSFDAQTVCVGLAGAFDVDRTVQLLQVGVNFSRHNV